MKKSVTASLLVIIGVPLLFYIVVWSVSEYKLSSAEAPAPFVAAISQDIDSIDHGRHIARTRGCFGCHGQQMQGRVFTEQWPWVKRAVAPNVDGRKRSICIL